MKKIYIALKAAMLLLVIGLAFLSGSLYSRLDRTGPEIVFEQDTVKYDGMNQQLFLVDVTAFDEKDGDVTDSLRIKTVLETEDEYIITYLAKDRSNNISERSRHIEKKNG